MLKLFALFMCFCASVLAHAEVTSVEVTNRQPWVGGQVFGEVGAYEVLRGTVRYAIDPRSAEAKDITDIRHAPVNAHGLVEYSGPFLIIRPVDGFMKAATASIDNVIAKRFLLSMQRNAIIEKIGGYWDEVAKFDWYLGKRQMTN